MAYWSDLDESRKAEVVDLYYNQERSLRTWLRSWIFGPHLWNVLFVAGARRTRLRLLLG